MRILVVTGASGGHIFPAAALIEALREEDPACETLLLLPERRVDAGLEGLRIAYLGIGNLRRRPFSALARSFWRLGRGSVAGLKLLIDFKPDLVVGFGTLSSVPVVSLAWFMRIKTMVHEQNVVPGRANALLARVVDRVAVSFEESRAFFPAKRTVVTGNPLRRSLSRIDRGEARRALGLDPGRFTVLVTGGSQGSETINRAAAAALRGLDPRLVQAVHIAGGKQADQVAGSYEGCPVTVKVFPFLKEMELAYSAADAAVCRAGATTCAELMYYRLPALIAPYPFAHAHQSRNAAVLAKRGCALVCEDRELDAAKVASFLSSCSGDPGFIARMREGFAGTDAAQAGRTLAKVCRETVR